MHMQRDYFSTTHIIPLSCKLAPPSLLLIPASQIKFTSYLAKHFMASTDKPADPEYESSSTLPTLAGVDNLIFDVTLRFLLFAASVVAIAVIVSGEQTELVLFQGMPVLQPAKFKYSPAFM